MINNICRGVFRTQSNHGTYNLEIFAKIVNSFQELTFFAESSILVIWLDSEFTSDLFAKYLQKKKPIPSAVFLISHP